MKILKFSTPDCSWCKVASPHVNRYAEENDLSVEEVDASVNTMKRDQYDVMTVPTVIIADDLGNPLQKLTGYPEIMAFINQ
jgi:thiol-disulfide isomerase/thioredoxin